MGYTPVIPPKSNRRHPWEYNRPITGDETRSNGSSDGSKATDVFNDKLDVIFLAFITLALIHDTLNVNTP